LNSETIRRRFVDFFVERGHLHLPGLPLAPNDAGITTLFTIAGMQQMIPYFLGREQPPSRNMVTVQKTIRMNDIDEVGDDYHLTFFEMLGNFSVGAYFKEQAIRYTWEFLTETMGVPADRWWAAVYPGDEESRSAWLGVGIPSERIGDDPENWWGPPGPSGPCGPNSEIHFDRGPGLGCGGPNCRPETGCCDRFWEVWNDVFMSFFQDESGDRRPLPWNNVDTGMGFERLVAALQNAQSVYDTDLFQPIISSVTRLTDSEYGRDAVADRSLRIIADHSRAITFIISDGVMPSSEGRGYVVRRLLRRAALHGRLLGIERPFLARPVSAVIDIMGGYHTELLQNRDRIVKVVEQEERRFVQTLGRGLHIFVEIADRAAAGSGFISGEDVFVLSDTHGFPLEMTAELARERGLSVDEAGFAEALRAQQQRASGRRFSRAIGTSPETFVRLAETIGPTIFTGYDELRTTSEVVALLAEGHPASRAEAGDEVEVILSSTPFYAESGGQVGDTGAIESDGALLRVTDTQRPYQSLIVHSVVVERRAIAVGDIVVAEVDAERRLHILPHHSGTHLIHQALQEVLGPDAKQAGSLVAPDRLRFDFTWPEPVSADDLREVQDRVNAAIWANLPVGLEVKSYDEAIAEGATALFGEKYGDFVRVVSIGDWSKELCGGTHVDATGDIGLLVIASETGIGSGVRRIEALAGAAAYTYVNGLRDHIAASAEALGTPPQNLVKRAEQVMEQARKDEKRLQHLTHQLAVLQADRLVQGAISVGGVSVVVDRITTDGADYLEVATDQVKARLERGIVVFGAVVGDKAAYSIGVTKNLHDEGFSAGALLKEALQESHAGKGGGRPWFARGGGEDASKIDEFLRTAVEVIRRKAEG
jgi:alanyl-tRNA synthetase